MSVQSYILYNYGFELKSKEMANIPSTTSTVKCEGTEAKYAQKRKIQLISLGKWVGQNIRNDTSNINL